MMEIQRLDPAAGPRFREIRLRSLQDAPDAFGSTYQDTAARPDTSWPEQLAAMATFVAARDGRDVGVVRGAPDHEDNRSVWLLSMWVAPEARGTGVGDALVEAVIGWARSSGFARMLLDVGEANLHANALYLRHGFRPNGQTGTLPPPREHVRERQLELDLS